MTGREAIAAAAAALPLALGLAAIAWRARASRTLNEVPAVAPPDAPPVSVVIPARDEARNIERCARSVLAARYPALEVLVVDDRSADGTGDIARAIAREEPRLRVVESAPLPEGWMGKQWACAQGAAAARAELLCFTDADTTHAPDLLARAVNELRARGADLVTVGGRQEMGTFWERVVQPVIFTGLLARYGSTERVNHSPRVADKIANGQFLLVRREAYAALGGHAAVRDKVAEDLALAQRFFAAGRRTVLVLGLDQLSTRMYASLDEIVRGWSKNIFVGGRDAMPWGAAGRALFPLLMLLSPLGMLVPPLLLVAALVWPLPAALVAWAALCVGIFLAWWAVVHRLGGTPVAYAVTFPLGAAVLLYIVVRALARGQRVEWKGREYQAR